MFIPWLALLLHQTAGVATPAVRPAWIETLPEAPGRLYALGTADLGPQEGQAMARASDRARLQVVARLRATVKGETLLATRSNERHDAGTVVGSSAREVREAVTVSAQAQDLPGLGVERTYVDGPGRTVYALAYLDVAQAEKVLAGRLVRLGADRVRLGTERSLRIRWQALGLKGALLRLEEAVNLLGGVGANPELPARVQGERTALEARLADLDKADLPSLASAKLNVGLRANLELTPALEAYLAAQLAACGWNHRERDPDLILELTFSGADRGPELIFADLDIYQGVTYHLEVTLKLLEGGGMPLGRPALIQIVQNGSPEGLMDEFRKRLERRLPRLFTDFRREFSPEGVR